MKTSYFFISFVSSLVSLLSGEANLYDLFRDKLLYNRQASVSTQNKRNQTDYFHL